ncbi:RNA polymerase sigma factor [Streptomyces sp. NPDC001833]|uniref:RNA polymerase sigma factor n=1 Tax=Streptomyces sp. NPDC001833 TaxID=3154658 RepID=UPI00332E05EE
MKQSLRSRLRDGDPEAFRELFQEMSQAIYAHAHRALGDWSLAEDVMSVTFLEVWRLRDRLEEEERPVQPWVYGIATNVLRNRSRARRRHGKTLERLSSLGSVPDFSSEVTDRIADAERLAAARAALKRLRRSDRDVFMLCVWSDLSYAEAAQALGVPIGTVRSRLSRARDRLRKLTEQELQATRNVRELKRATRQIQGDRKPAVPSTEEKAR